eukprot:TRINITY_DN9073_c0_g1_i2.p1 TRINITY_DN9073_c0_g1~~TRINITY_DN9073_c0_g1_i2.p1  ORF type:complete len:528 (+),score=92.91 TRINITY_DN9073_c0_g1_i2:162-1745(+)
MQSRIVRAFYRRKRLKRAKIATGVLLTTGISSSVYASYASDIPYPIMLRHIGRFMRSSWAGLKITIDYKYSFRGIERDHPDYRSIRNECNTRTAKRLLSLCYKNKGIYVKAGQHIASLNHVLPQEVTSILAVLQDKADHVGYENVVEVFKQEFGKDPSDVFPVFDKTPIAAASLAQVHRAEDVDGRECAVKVQYPNMKHMLAGDMVTITFLVKAIAWSFPEFEFGWILPEFESAMKEEISFINEGKNAERTMKYFENDRNIYVPKIYWDLTTERILTMEYIHGIKINNITELEKANIDLKTVSEDLVKCFSKQIFVYGWIHSDPHPGNLLVRKVNNRPQLVILDHGLYKEFPDELRIPYCKLWRALVIRDQDNIEKYARELGAGDLYELFGLILAFRPHSNNDVGLENNWTEKDRENVKKMFKGKHFSDILGMINALLESVPRPMLFVLRTNNLVRSINKELGAQVNRYKIFARTSMEGLETVDIYQNHWWWYAKLIEISAYLQFEILVYWNIAIAALRYKLGFSVL